MNIKTMFSKANYEQVWKCLCSEFFRERYSDEKLERYYHELKSAIKEIISLTPSDKDNNDWIIIIDRRYDDLSPENKTQYLDSFLFQKSDIYSNFKIDDVIEKDIDISDWSLDKIKDYFKDRHVIMSYGYYFTSWSEIISFEIWDDSIEEFGLDVCAAAILYEMTYCGPTQKDVEKKAEEIFNRDSEETVTLEEAMDDIFDDLEEETVEEIIQSMKKTEEEKDEELRQCFIISQKNEISMYKKLKKYFLETQGEKDVCDS